MGKKLVFDIEKVFKSYQENQVLKNISLKWEEGILGLIGPNGTGKSTLIKIISTLLRPDSGYIKILGKDVLKEPLEVRKRIGVLFENPVFHPNLKVLSSLCWLGEIRNLSKKIAKHQAHELLEYFELNPASDYRLRELSAGMRQKYGLICATIGNPPLIILDEPTSNLDPDSRRLYTSYVSRLAQEHKCNFLISSHVLEELNRLCNGFVFLFGGVLTEFGKREDLLSKLSSQQHIIITKNPHKLYPLLIDERLQIKSVNDTKITVKEESFQKLMDILLRLQKQGFVEEFKIKTDSEIETLYQKLSSQFRKRI